MTSNGKLMTIGTGWALIALLSASLVLFRASPVFADQKMKADQLVQKAQLTLKSFMCDKDMSAFRDLIQRADGVLIVPSLLKGAFIVGASGGSGVLLVRDPASGTWSGPAFYTLAGASFGLQIGGQSSEVVLLAMTQRGVDAFLDTSFKLGADVGVAAGPVGMGASAATANLSADILSFSRSKGLYGGVSLDGAVVAVRDGVNRAYFGEPASPTAILITHKVRTSQGEQLAEGVKQAASGTAPVQGCARGAGAIDRPHG